jgi:hypothetical protein
MRASEICAFPERSEEVYPSDSIDVRSKHALGSRIRSEAACRIEK